MKRARWRRWTFAGFALALAAAAGQVLPVLNEQRTELGLTGYTAIGDAPPGLVLATTALGGLRAIIVDVLWMRAIDLQQNGKFFELVQLFDWIGKLQPRFPQVWSYASWNLAYNVSTNFPMEQPQQRWRWVRRGIEVLRDKGIPSNRNAAELYRDLAWIYSHKIGGSSDDAHHYYKVQLAIEMEDALGLPPYDERLKAMAAALERRNELLADPDIAQLLAELERAGFNAFDDPLALLQRSDDLPAPARQVIERHASSPALERLEVLLRGYQLRENLLLDPARMYRLMKHFGPIDWRLPDALALYWAAWSLELVGGDPLQAANKDRMVFASLKNLYDRGTLHFDRGGGERSPVYLMAPHFGFLDRVVEAHREIAERYKASDLAAPTKDAYIDFLRDSIVSLYLHNSKKRAAEYLKLLQQEGRAGDQMLEEFVEERFGELARLSSSRQATAMITGLLFESLFRSSLGQLDEAAAAERRARILHALFNSSRPERAQLGSFAQLRQVAMVRALQTFRPFQVERLRELYPMAVEQAEQHIRRRKQPTPGRSTSRSST